MARLQRRVGINSAQIRLPAPASAGPAIIKTAQTVAQREFQKEADRQTQRAQQAAMSINFERDNKGNLLPPQMPLGENGLLAPSIYDREYTQMVSQRYLQQMDVDTSSQLNQLASEHLLDPDGFAEVAHGYVTKVTELAPDLLKADVNMTAQKRMVEHHNRMVRERAEADWTDSRNTQIEAIDRIQEEAQNAATTGDDDAVMEQYLKFEANLLQGEVPNFWDESYPAARRQAFNDQLISSYMIGDVIRTPVDEGSIAVAKQGYQDFIDGKGKVKIVVDGELKEVDVAEAMPDENRRRMIGENAISAANAREAAATNSENARHNRQMDEFLQEFMRHAVAREDAGLMPDRALLLDWFDRADATNNETLKARIRSELGRAMPSGRSLNETEKEFDRQMTNLRERITFKQESFAKENGYERFELMPTDVQSDFIADLHSLVQGIAMDQTGPSARMADMVYQSSNPNLEWHTEEQGGTPIRELDRFIKTEMQMIGIIPQEAINFFGSIINNIDSASGEETMRMLSIFESMRDTPALRGKLSKALGESDFAALAFIHDRMLPSQQRNTAALKDTFERAQKGTLNQPWHGLNDEEQVYLEERVKGQLKNYNNPWWKLEGAAIPVELRDEALLKLRGAVHMLGTEPSQGQLTAVADSIVQELTTSLDSPWRWDGLGLNADKARSFGMYGPDVFVGTPLGGALSKQPSNGYSEYSPKYWTDIWAQDHPGSSDQIYSDAIVPDLQAELNKLKTRDQFGDIPLRAGENVHVRYNGVESMRAGEPAYELYITVKDGDAEQITTDGRWNGEPVYYYPQDAVLKLREDMLKAEEEGQPFRTQRQKKIDEMPFPNDRGIRP